MSERTAKLLRRQGNILTEVKLNPSSGMNRKTKRSYLHVKDRTFTAPGKQIYDYTIKYLDENKLIIESKILKSQRKAWHVVNDYRLQREFPKGTNHDRMMQRKINRESQRIKISAS